MVKKQKTKTKTKLFPQPKFGSRRGSASASLKIDEILPIRKKIGKFLGGRTYFTLLVDRFYTNKIGSSATWKSCFCFFTDGKQHKARKLDMIPLRNHAPRYDMITRDLECPRHDYCIINS